MEEIALVLSSLAGACTAVALDRIPRYKHDKQTTAINSTIINQLHTLSIEKEILAKTITRLHQEGLNLSKIQRDKLLIRYQHQLGTIIAKIEKLETASKYPDLGLVGDSLITLMDNKLSKIDQRLYEISSKMSVNSIPPPAQPTVQIQSSQIIKQQEHPKDVMQEKPRIENTEAKIEIQKEEIHPPMIPMEIPVTQRGRSVELSTLTEIPRKKIEFPAEFIKPHQAQVDKIEIITEPLMKSIESSKKIIPIDSTLITKEEPVSVEIKPVIEQIEKKIQLPIPIKIPEEEKIEDDDKDLDKIKNEIMKALSKLEQVEVE